MQSLRFAVVGTNWITGALVDAGRTVPGFEVGAVCSRSHTTGRRFAERYGIDRVHTDVADLAEDGAVDAVYLASPNSLHATQAITLLRAGKHVLIEKPMGADAGQVAAIAHAAAEAGRTAMEAYVAPPEPNVRAIRSALTRLGTLRRAVLVKEQYSSRYDALKAGRLPNTFNPEFAAGSLMDLGFYGIALAIHLFGSPQRVTATGHLLPTGVDGQGSVLLGYSGFEVACLHSKLAPSAIGSQITGEDGVLSFDDCSVPTRVTLVPREGEASELARAQAVAHMRYEVEEFMSCAGTGRVSDLWPVEQSLAVAQVLDEARGQVGVRFPSDPQTLPTGG